jgi:protein involved in polysaccharide export with SLBB domain
MTVKTHLQGAAVKGLQPGAKRRCPVLLSAAIVALWTPVPASAQLLGANNVPSGSPLDSGNTSGGAQQNGRNGAGDNSNNSENAQQSSTTPYQPVLIGGASAAGRDAAGQVATPQGPRMGQNGLLEVDSLRLKKPAEPGEFEKWAMEITGRKLKRYGSDLLSASARDFAVPATSTIPPDYALNVGDTVSISLTGSVEGSVDAEIDRDGRIFLPNVGSVSLVGVRYRDLKDRIAAAVGRQYRGYDVSVSISKLRGVRVYVTGFANNPGAYSVNSLSTLVNAVLAAGGPSAGGSFRSIKLYRNGAEVADFDLYQLLRKGDRSLDPILQNEDVLFIPPVDRQIAVIGSVNEEAIYEVRRGESLADALALAGGPTDVADQSRLMLYRLSDRDTVGSREIDRARAAAEPAEAGDIVQILPQGTLARSLDRQQAVVRIEGEVNRPGNYVLPPNTPVAKVVEMAGGLTPRAFVYGTRFFRESVRAQQQQSYSEAIDQMEVSLAVSPLSGNDMAADGDRQAQLAAARAFVEKLRQKQPDGRLVMELKPNQSSLPDQLLLENNDHIVIPPRVQTVGVFGAVYRPASFLLDGSPRKVADYVQQAGGPIRGADKGNIFLVRANGAILTRRKGAMGAVVLPGDTVFVPIKSRSTSVWTKIREISTIMFQFGVTAAAIAAIN